MHRGAIAVVVALVVGAIVAPGAGAGSSSTPPKLGASVIVTLGAPAPGGSEFVQLTVDALATKGAVGSLRVTGVNAALPPGVRVVAVVTPVGSSHANQTFGVTFAIDNLGGGSATPGSIVDSVEPAGVGVNRANVFIEHYVIRELNCRRAVEIGHAVDTDALMTHAGRRARYLLFRLRSQTVQRSPSEEVLDNTIYNRCSSTAGVERPDHGNS